MRTKYLILFLSLFCCVGIKAIEREISLQSFTDDKDTWQKDRRSITLEPTATIDMNTIRIRSNIIIENLSVAIKDQFGNTVYINITKTPSTCQIFEIYDLPEGSYTLEIKFGDAAFYGYFSY